MAKLKLLLSRWLKNLTYKLKNNFYLYLGLLFTLLLLMDAGIFHVGENMRERAFDLMVKYRVFQPKADPNIAIIDIDEKSLAALSGEYGRWPWPRQVLGELVENLAAQKPKAIVFDILFSDADIYNPDSDDYFNGVIAETSNAFFPILRLDASQDKLSQLKYAQIPGLQASANADVNATTALILPHFNAALRADRLGTNNVYPDNDGIVREYRMYEDDNGWRLPSLPLIVAQYVGGKNSRELPQNMLINWRGKPFSYTYVSFSDVYTDLASKVKKRSPNEFTNKIVIIGSTAPGLFDIKPTAMDKQFPGVEILATAIDNAQHNDYLKVWRGKIPYILLSLLLIWATTFAFYFNVDRDKFNSVFTGGQAGLLVLSYVAINISHTYLDLTAPILWAVSLFGIAKAYALANERALQKWLDFGVNTKTNADTVLIMPISIESRDTLGETLLKKIKHRIALMCTAKPNIEFMRGTQSGVWGLFADMIVISWVYENDENENKQPTQANAAKADSAAIIAGFTKLTQGLGLLDDTLIRYSTHEAKLENSDDPYHSITSQWRSLLAQAVIKMELEDQLIH